MNNYFSLTYGNAGSRCKTARCLAREDIRLLFLAAHKESLSRAIIYGYRDPDAARLRDIEKLLAEALG